MVEDHPRHEPAYSWLKRVTIGPDEGVVAAHSLAELYAVLTTLPVHPPITPHAAQQLIEQNILRRFRVVALSAQEYEEVIQHLSSTGVIGGATYDALILQSAKQAAVDLVVTFNVKDFQRVFPKLKARIVEP